MLDYYRRRWFWLRFVPGVYLLVNGRECFGFVDKLLGLGVTGFGGEQRHHCGTTRRDVWLQRFPGLMAYSARSRSCTIELLFSGDRAMTSLRAATMIQNWAEDKNSKDMVRCAVVLPA